MKNKMKANKKSFGSKPGMMKKPSSKVDPHNKNEKKEINSEVKLNVVKESLSTDTKESHDDQHSLPHEF